MSNKPFPNPRTVLTDLLSQLPQTINLTSPSTNPLIDAPSSTKNILLTFHVLYPNEFLSALDLLDRHLLTRFVVRTENGDHRRESTAEPTSTSLVSVENNHVTSMAVTGSQQPLCQTPLYFVRSAQQPRNSGTGRTYDPLAASHYEVRPTAWNCSCPALAFAAFPASIGIAGSTPSNDLQGEVKYEGRGFGGLSRTNGMPPACKHLLACVLAEQCDILKGFVEQKEISTEELAGWCVGWGD
jgi:hypothetical protein